MDDLYEQAIAAGIFPDPAISGRKSYDPPATPGLPTTEPFRGVAGYVPDAASDTTPDAPAPGALGAPVSMTAGAKTSVSAGGNGFSGSKYDQIGAKVNDPLARQYAADDAAANEAYNPILAAENRAYTAQRKATEGVQFAQAQKSLAESRASLDMANLQKKFANEEQTANVASQHEAEMAKADYVTALADLRAQQVNPGRLWSSLTPGMRAGMMATAFVHDFLGARGIKTSAMDTFNQAVDRDINAQVQNIKTKGEVAEGFKSLWYMQRSQSASDAEARARVKGFMIDSFKSQVIGEMGKYEAGLATAQGQAAIAALDKAQADNMKDVYEHIEANAMARRQQSLALTEAKMRNAQEGWRNSIAAQELAMRKEAALKAAQPGLDQFVADTSPSGQGRIKWQFTAGQPDEQDEVRKRLGSLALFEQQTADMRQLLAQRKKESPGGMAPGLTPDNLRTPLDRQILGLQNDMAHTWAYADSGKQLTQKEIDDKYKLLPVDTWATRGDVDEQFSQTVKNQHDKTYAYASQFMRPLAEGEAMRGVKLTDAMPGYGGTTPESYFGAAEAEDNRINATKSVTPPDKTSYAVKALGRPDRTEKPANDTLDKFGGMESASNHFQQYIKDSGEPTTRSERNFWNPVIPEDVPRTPSVGIVAIDTLRKQAPSDPRAMETLQQYATKPPEGADGELIKSFAQWSLMDLTQEQHKQEAPLDYNPMGQ